MPRAAGAPPCGDRCAPDHAEFLSQARYIVTRSEEKIFLELPASQRDAFIGEFWKRRDPDPYSEENEFKVEYFSRLETANRLFAREGKPGWMTDRGRIHILFGPPFDRIINPIDGGSGERCSEIWYYGGFPVVFRDPDCSGHLELATYDLSAIREYNLSYMHELSRAQEQAQKTAYRIREPFGFRGRARLEGTRSGLVEGMISLSIPYAGIWFEAPEVGSLVTTLEVEVDLRDAAGVSRWAHRGDFGVTSREETLEREPDRSVSPGDPLQPGCGRGSPAGGGPQVRGSAEKPDGRGRSPKNVRLFKAESLRSGYTAGNSGVSAV